MEDLKKSFLARGNNIVGSGGSGEENTIESISVNGVDIAPDENKNVDITFLPTTTTEPTEAWTGGGHKIVILSSEPETKYDGWIYLIAEEV